MLVKLMKVVKAIADLLMTPVRYVMDEVESLIK